MSEPSPSEPPASRCWVDVTRELECPEPAPAASWDLRNRDLPLESASPNASLPLESSALEEALSPSSWEPTQEDVARLFNQYRNYVAKIARRILGPGADVEDLIQDVFVLTIQNVQSVKDPSRLKGWLATVTTRHARRRRYRPSVQDHTNRDDPDEFLYTASEAPSPESSANLSKHIQHLMNLPEELRRPWLLRHVEGKTLEDIATQCDCSTSTAQRRIRSASSRLSSWRS